MQKFNHLYFKKLFKIAPFNFFEKFFYRFAINSTNIFAASLINSYDSNFVVLADYQYKGKGRFDRKWISPPAENLYFSIVLQNNFILPQNKILFKSANAVLKTLKSYNPDFKIKWPNDIIFHNKKISGILIENIYSSEKITATIIGIGININTAFNSNNRFKAISLKEITNTELRREEVLENFLRNFIDEYKNTDSFNYWRKNLAFKNKKIRFHIYDKYIGGTFHKVDKKGNIMLITDSGKIKKYNLGEIIL